MAEQGHEQMFISLPMSVTVDPQYLYILPRYLTATDRLKAKWTQHSKDAYFDRWPMYLKWLCDGDPKNFDQIAPEQKQPRAVKSFQEMQWAHDVYSRAAYAKDYSKDLFINTLLTWSALQLIGLDIHGGLERMLQIKRYCMLEKKPFMTTSIIVVDAMEACKWVQLGVGLKRVTFEEASESHEAAVQRYTKLKELIGRKKYKGAKIALKEAIGKKPNSELLNDLKWELGRINFNLEVLRRAKAACTASGSRKEKSSIKTEPRSVRVKHEDSD